MKILVYGAGVIGSYLIHVLMQAGNEVTVVSKSGWGQVLQERGLCIRHQLQKRKSQDYPKVVSKPDFQTHYDMVFSVMQAPQQWEVLPDIAKVHTDLVLLVGNNLQAEVMAKKISAADDTKRVLFGFQPTGGVRKPDHVVCVRWGKGSMTIGGLHAYPQEKDRKLLQQAFGNSGYELEFMDDMNGWLWSHMAFILPIVYICYFYHCNLRLSDKRDAEDLLQAASEGFAFLQAAAIAVRPKGIDEQCRRGMKRWMLQCMLRMMAKTSLGELAASDHCRNAVQEMRSMDMNFEALRRQYPDFKMPTWEKLRNQMPSWQEIQETYCRKTA